MDLRKIILAIRLLAWSQIAKASLCCDNQKEFNLIWLQVADPCSKLSANNKSPTSWRNLYRALIWDFILLHKVHCFLVAPSITFWTMSSTEDDPGGLHYWQEKNTNRNSPKFMLTCPKLSDEKKLKLFGQAHQLLVHICTYLYCRFTVFFTNSHIYRSAGSMSSPKIFWTNNLPLGRNDSSSWATTTFLLVLHQKGKSCQSKCFNIKQR